MKPTAAKIPFFEKVGYSLGDTASNLFWQTFSMFLLFFYTDIFGISAAAAGTMFLVTRIWDTVNDPLMGIIADRTNTRWGKFRPFLLWMALPFGIIGILTFTTPDFGSTGKIVYAYITYSFMMMVYTAINIPYSALMGVMSPNSLERTSLSSFRFVAAFGGGLIVQATALKLVKITGGDNQALGWRWTMTIFAVLAVILFLTTFTTTKERVKPPKTQKTSLVNDLSDLFSNIPWLMLFLIGIFLLTFVSIRNGSIMYYFKYYVGDQTFSLFGKSYSYDKNVLASAFMVFGSLANIVGVLSTRYISELFGKRRAFIILMLLTTVLTAVFYVLKNDAIISMFTIQVIISFIMGPLSPMIWAMYTDTADYSEWRTGRRATGLVMSASTMAQKFGWTIGGALAGWLLAAFGFKANQAQSAETLHGISLLISIIPAVCAVLGAAAMFFYKLDDETMKQIEIDLAARKSDES
jgi:GPH family glycoside/pentoside/hexuronide:cation symporter